MFTLRFSYNYLQRFADLRWAGFLPLNFIRSTKLSATTKLSAENGTPPIANVLLSAALLSVRSGVGWVLSGMNALSPCGCLHSLLLLLRLPVWGGKRKCECKGVGFRCTVCLICSMLFPFVIMLFSFCSCIFLLCSFVFLK